MTDDDLDRDPTAARLRAEQPAPAPGFRGELSRWVRSEHAPGRPPRLATLVTVCFVLGMLLLLGAALGLAGSGPLGY